MRAPAEQKSDLSGSYLGYDKSNLISNETSEQQTNTPRACPAGQTTARRRLKSPASSLAARQSRLNRA
ncbi:protein of unknown function [Burkholderia multivorans]